jgi:hypothetical protein
MSSSDVPKNAPKRASRAMRSASGTSPVTAMVPTCARKSVMAIRRVPRCVTGPSAAPSWTVTNSVVVSFHRSWPAPRRSTFTPSRNQCWPVVDSRSIR